MTQKMSTGRLADEGGVGIQTVRYYERIGLLPSPPRAPNGHRRYSEEDARRLRFIRSSGKLGFTLDEIRELLELRVEVGESCESVSTTASRVIERIDTKVDELGRMRSALGDLRAACEANHPTGECPILEALEGESN